MAKYWEDTIFPQFLKSVDSCTLLELTNFQIQEQLNYLAVRAINDFKFPKTPLTYDLDTEINPDTEEQKGYYFLEDNLGQKEYNVILARMKQYWVDYQISQERLFQNAYYDKDIRLHSPGNTIDKMLKMFTTLKDAADRAEYDYGRVNATSLPSIGDINE